jgi:archaeosine synthase
MQEIAEEVRIRLDHGTLREFVELSTHFENPVAATLRNFDMMCLNNPPPGTRLNKSSPLQCTSVEAYTRPELVLFRQQLLQRYIIPDYKKVIVLLPCAATKPYSNSPSHRKMLDAIQRGAKSLRGAVEQLIITSPIGIVPRALEDIYPAAFYDVPVTGHWDDAEVQLSVDLLVALLNQCSPDMTVIALAEGGYLSVCQQVQSQVRQPVTIFEPEPKLLSYNVLADFAARIGDALFHGEPEAPPPIPPPACEHFGAVADFQFGLGAGPALFASPLKIQTPPQGSTRIVNRVTREVIATVQSSGLLRPSVMGAQQLLDAGIPTLGIIGFAGEKLSGSSLFATGVESAEGDIRPGDFVTIVNRSTGALLATAEAVVDRASMLHLRHGAVAKILDKAKRGSR